MSILVYYMQRHHLSHAAATDVSESKTKAHQRINPATYLKTASCSLKTLASETQAPDEEARESSALKA